jgi:hypothetical protein
MVSTYRRKVPGSNISRDTGSPNLRFSCIFSSLQANARTAPRLRHYRLLPNPLDLIFISYQSTCCVVTVVTRTHPSITEVIHSWWWLITLNSEALILSRVWWLVTGYGLLISFIGLLEIVTTVNYNAFANSHTPQFTTARTKCSQSVVSSPVVAW